MIEINRQIYQDLDIWKHSIDRHPLLVRGARQVGKSFAIRTWAKKNFQNYLEINLEESKSLGKIFEGDLTIDLMLEKIELGTGINLRHPDSILFIDEIQCQPRALMALRYFYENFPELHVIAAGSLIEFVIEEVGIPVGRVDQLYVHPINFTEFLLALNKEHLVKQINKSKLASKISDIAHNQLLNCLRTYYYVGGMPSAVATYISSGDLGATSAVHARIIKGYEDDFQKYSKKSDWGLLQSIFKRSPSLVGNSRLKYSNLDREIRGEKLKKALELLCKAQILTKVISTYSKKIPLESGIQEKFFKIIYLDIGLLHHQLGFDWRSIEIDKDLTDIKSGAFAEQFIGQELRSKSSVNKNIDLYYWYRSVKGSDAEVDYIINYKNLPTPIEVKSGSRGTLKSLIQYIKEFDSKNNLVFSQRNIEVMDNILFLPLYMICSNKI